MTTTDRTSRRVAVVEQTHGWGDCIKHTAPDDFRHCHCQIEIAALRDGQPRTCRHCTTTD